MCKKLKALVTAEVIREKLQERFADVVEFTYGADIIRVSSVSGNLYEISKNGTIYKTTLDIPTLENELIKIGVINSL